MRHLVRQYHCTSKYSFNSRTPCGVRQPAHRIDRRQSRGFNSRTPCGVRPDGVCRDVDALAFQFTHPVRGATESKQQHYGTDLRFNSRTPCGVRHLIGCGFVQEMVFQFTHPVRGATLKRECIEADVWVSIHAPRAGCDGGQYEALTSQERFNSRTPCGVRRLYRFPVEYVTYVSIHAPRAGCDSLAMWVNKSSN